MFQITCSYYFINSRTQDVHLAHNSSKNIFIQLQKSVEDAVGPATDIGIENLSGDVNSRKTATNAVVIRANRSLDLLDVARAKIDSISDRTNKVCILIYSLIAQYLFKFCFLCSYSNSF